MFFILIIVLIIWLICRKDIKECKKIENERKMKKKIKKMIKKEVNDNAKNAK